MTDLLPAARPPIGGERSTSARTRVVLDTSVLIADPSCVTSFDDVDVVIPLIVVEELDGLKTRPDDVGRSARAALRAIEELRVRHGGSLAEPVPVGDGGGSLQIELNGIQKHLPRRARPRSVELRQPDHRRRPRPGRPRSRRRCCPTTPRCGSRPPTSASPPPSTSRPGGRCRPRPPAGRRSRRPTRSSTACTPPERSTPRRSRRPGPSGRTSSPCCGPGSQSALTRRIGDELDLLSHAAPEAWGLRARSKEQRFALELLLDPAIEVIALDGRAGTGKTLLAVAAGLEQVVEQSRYERLAIYRPLVPVGRADVGFLPGGLDEKLDPWMAAIHDAVVALTDHGSNTDARHLIDELTARGQLSLESVTFLRGRSLQRQMVIIDEAQNLEPTTLRTILTRVGEGTKVVFTGDTSQIDAPYLGESNNALAVLTQAFSGQSCFGHITLTACERSDVASLAAELL